MSLFKYNGIYIPYPFHTDYRQEAVSDPSDTDLIGTKFVLSLTGTIHANANYLTATGITAGASPAVIMGQIRSKLTARRKELSVTVGGMEMIPRIPTNAGKVDSMNGPIPKYCNIQQLTNDTFLISYQIEAMYWENMLIDAATGAATNRNTGGDVLYNRWSESVTYDQCMYCTYARTGKYIIRSDNPDAFTVDNLRPEMAIVTPVPGFVRTRANYKVDPSGLGLEYDLEDKEVAKLPPFPAFEADGRYTETTTDGGAVRRAQCWVKLRGPKTVNRSQLIKVAVSVCTAKINTGGVMTIQPSTGGRALLSTAVVSVGMYDNWVEVTMNAAMQPRTTADGKGRVGGMAGLRFDGMAGTPGSDPGQIPAGHPQYLDGGTTPFLLKAAAYFDPSVRAFVDRTTRQLNVGGKVGQGGVIP